MPKPSKNSELRNYKKPKPTKPAAVQIPDYATRKRQADEANSRVNSTIAKYENPNVSTSCVYNKGFTGLKVGG